MALLRSRSPRLRELSPGRAAMGSTIATSTAGRATSPGTTRRVRRWLAATTTAALGASLGLAVLAAPAQATLAPAFGPVDVSTGFPSYYEDTTGLRVEPCLNSTFCLAPGGPLAPPEGEMFYNSASATQNLPARTGVPGGRATLTLALEGAYAGDGPGQEVVFGRSRFVATGGLTPGETYTVTHPYGTDTFVANATGGVSANEGTEDIGGLGPCLGPNAHAAGGACDFGEATTSRIGPFLKWNPAVAPAAPAGYLGDARSTHAITGSPTGNNTFKIVGPGVNTTQNLFTVSGREAGPAKLSTSKLAFGSQQLGTESAAQSVKVTNIG